MGNNQLIKRLLIILCSTVLGGAILISSLYVFNVFGASTTHTKANSDKITVANNGGIAGGAITLAIWVNQQATPGTNTSHGWLSQGDGDTNDVHYGFRYLDAAGTLKVHFTRNVKGVVDCAAEYIFTVPNNEWH